MFKKSEVKWPDGDSSGKGCALILFFVGVGILFLSSYLLHAMGAL